MQSQESDIFSRLINNLGLLSQVIRDDLVEGEVLSLFFMDLTADERALDNDSLSEKERIALVNSFQYLLRLILEKNDQEKAKYAEVRRWLGLNIVKRAVVRE
jgi:hypothetical protein